LLAGGGGGLHSLCLGQLLDQLQVRQSLLLERLRPLPSLLLHPLRLGRVLLLLLTTCLLHFTKRVLTRCCCLQEWEGWGYLLLLLC
jgi:hypothetical protein